MNGVDRGMAGGIIYILLFLIFAIPLALIFVLDVHILATFTSNFTVGGAYASEGSGFVDSLGWKLILSGVVMLVGGILLPVALYFYNKVKGPSRPRVPPQRRI